MSRLKTSTETDMRVFIHADTYQVCPLHALATMLITNSPTDALFPHIPIGSESQYVNRLLKELLEELDEDSDVRLIRVSRARCLDGRVHSVADEHDLFRSFCATLLACAEPALQYPLMCSVLLHWDEMYRDVPEHHIFGRMMSAGVSTEKIHEWILCVRRAFRNMNAPFLPVSELEPTDSVPYATIQEFFAKTIETLNLVRTQLSEEVIKREESDRVGQ
eukprot:gene27010-33667_t